MSAINDGGPAFPTLPTYDTEGYPEQSANGMTKRDYFAAQALQGLLANPSSGYLAISHLDWPKRCYEIADAMVAASEVKS